MSIIYRTDSARPLTWEQLDDNFRTVESIASEVTRQVDISSQFAESARESSEAAGNYVDIARSAVNEAKSYAGVWSTQELGIGNTVSGQCFGVPSVDDINSTSLYENRDGISVDTGKRYPSTQYLESIKESTASADQSKNLANVNSPDVVIGSRLNASTGNTISSAGMNTSGFIPVSSGNDYVISGSGDTCWYTSQRVFISGSSTGSDNRVDRSPSSAAFIRVSTSTSAPNRWAALQVEAGVTRTKYSPFGKYLSPSQAKNNTLNGSAVALGSLPSSAVSFLNPSKNLFKKNAALLGKFINGATGTITDNATYNLTGPMPVVPGQTYTGKGATGMRSGAFFDSAGHALPGGFSTTTETLTIPPGVSFLNASLFATDQDKFQFEIGSISTSYISGSLTLTDKDGQGININPDKKSLTSDMYADKSVATLAIADKAVTPDKESWLIASNNLFRASTATPGAFMSQTGNISADGQYFYSAKIPVKPSTTYAGGSNNPARSMRFTTYFAADGVTVVTGGSSASLASFTIPASGVAFVVVTGWAQDMSTFRFNEGALLMPWKAWGYEIDNNAGIGFPASSPVEPIYGQWFLRETRNRLNRMLISGSTVQLPIINIGDSWSQLTARYTMPVAAGLRAVYGDAGVGYVSFAKATASLPNGNATFQNAITYIGTWDISVYGTSYSPDIGQVSSSESGATLRYTAASDVSAINLFAAGGAGIVRYRWGGGAWTTIDLSALSDGFKSIALPGWSTSTSSSVDIEVVSGTPILFGLDVQKTAKGIRWNKLGASGTRASQWAAVDATQWKAGISAFSPKLAIIMHGTNDQSSYSPADHKIYMQTIITRLKEVDPLMDIFLIAPCENGRSNTWPMSDYAKVQRELSVENSCAFMDLQYYFGNSFSQYSASSGRPWMNADGIHPEPGTGGQTIVDAIMRFTLYSI